MEHNHLTEAQEIEKEIKVEKKIDEILKESKWMIPASIVVAGLVIAGAVIYSSGTKNYAQPANGNQQAAASTPKVNENDSVLGDAKAPVTIIAFEDFQCPFCSKFTNETESQIIKNYVDTGKAKLVFKPIAILGDESKNAALADYCAKDQGKFWEFQKSIYGIEYAELQKYMAGTGPSSENNGNLTRDLFAKVASDLKMDSNAFLNCYDSKKYNKVLTDNLQEASAALNGKISTPTVFINGQMVQGAQPYDSFAAVIDAFLNK